jgi:chromosomal replication initiation ATPase DnaA
LLAGRERELDALYRALATALTGVRQLLFVTGEAGLGKTTLVDAFLTALEEYGRSGSGAASASNITEQGRPICQCWRRWDACVEDLAG